MFDREKTFMYDVWYNVLQTDVGKNLVRDHKDAHMSEMWGLLHKVEVCTAE